MDPRRAKSIVSQHGRESLCQHAAAALPELVRCCREVVRAHDLGNATECPQCALDPLDQRLERLAEGHLRGPPSARAQHELEEQMRERLAGDRHTEFARVREIDLRLAARWMHLRKEHLARRTLAGAPLADPPLQRSHLPGGEAARMAPREMLEQERRLEHALRVAHEQRLDLARPYLGERIRPRPPRARLLRLGRQWPALPRPRRPHAHPRRRGRRRLRLPLHPLLPQPAHLCIRDHRSPPRDHSVTRPTLRLDRQF